MSTKKGVVPADLPSNYEVQLNPTLASHSHVVLIRYTGPIISLIGVLSAATGYLKNSSARKGRGDNSEVEELTDALLSVEQCNDLSRSIAIILNRKSGIDEAQEIKPISSVWLASELKSEISRLHMDLQALYPSINEVLVEDCRILESRLNSIQSDSPEEYISDTQDLLAELDSYLELCEITLLDLVAK